MALRLQNMPEPTHIYDHTRPLQKLYDGATLIWQAVHVPDITSFYAVPANINLDTRPSGTVTFNFMVIGTTGQDTHAQIVKLPNGENVGATFTGVNGAPINDHLPNIPQPNQTTSYRLIARTNAGAAHEDFTIHVTQNPRITNFRRTGYNQSPAGNSFVFGATIIGYPQPALSYRFSNGAQGVITPRHLTSSGTNQWTLNWGSFPP